MSEIDIPAILEENRKLTESLKRVKALCGSYFTNHDSGKIMRAINGDEYYQYTPQAANSE